MLKQVMMGVVLAAAALAEPMPDETYLHPGTLLAIDGTRRLNLVCAGKGSPTVLFDSGLATSMRTWRLVQAEVATKTRACAYDRAGIGFSDPRSTASDAKAVVADLHALLTTGAVNTPILYVGHSMAGLYGVLLQATHPEDVAGAVLVDPSFADQSDAMTSAAIAAGAPPAVRAAFLGFMQKQAQRLRQCATLPAPLPQDCVEVPGDLSPALTQGLRAQQSRPSYLLTDASEFESFTGTAGAKSVDQQELEAVSASFGNKPLLVLTSSKSMGYSTLTTAQNAAIDRAWKAGHDRLAALSTRGSNTVVPDSGHNIQHDQPQAVIDAIDKAVAQIRAP